MSEILFRQSRESGYLGSIFSALQSRLEKGYHNGEFSLRVSFLWDLSL